MSSRLYPIFQKGNPQMRVFLPNFWMKMVRPQIDNAPKNKVQFVVHPGMSQFDVKSYLEKIYEVPVVHVRTYIQEGRYRRVPQKGYIVKDDDYKVAFVTLPKDTTFEFPNIFPEEKAQEVENEEKHMDILKENFKKHQQRNRLRPDVPGWFL
ncbi:putative 39S ribosomal protein L23, mitochondrial [Orchesella cincta]|uniref:Large ribosomal subunit protein uL23m n=1 Tax=Orchesella cincta TaxID=48709 RepID=A0A1D2MGV7_ORCCI|nr:putative 39S ribosomal protein L23, mitochondrial [Orchesella cincta]